MEISILQLIEGARQASGLTVIIDVFRAFSLACYAFNQGAEKIIPVGDIRHAYNLKEKHPEYILMGERNEQIIPGFDYGNSPSQIQQADLKEKVIVQSTSAGTQGLVNAVNAKEILTGSFVNASAIINYIKNKNPDKVSLVCMGYSTRIPVEEDTFCAEYIKNGIEGKQTDYNEMLKIIRITSGQRFFEESKQHFSPSEDFRLCTELNRFNFVIKTLKEDGQLILKPFMVR